MELRRPCKMMSIDQWEGSILVSWSSSALWLVEQAVGHKNAHQHEWAAILHYLGPFAAYFTPYPPTATFYNQPLYCTNNDSAVKSPKNGDCRRNLPKFWFCADDYERVGIVTYHEYFVSNAGGLKFFGTQNILKMHSAQMRKWKLNRKPT